MVSSSCVAVSLHALKLKLAGYPALPVQVCFTCTPLRANPNNSASRSLPTLRPCHMIVQVLSDVTSHAHPNLDVMDGSDWDVEHELARRTTL